MQIRPTAFTIGLIIHFSIALFSVYTEFGIDSDIMTVLIFSNDVIWLFYGFGDCQNHVLTFKSLSTLLIDKKLETALFNFLCKSNK